MTDARIIEGERAATLELRNRQIAAVHTISRLLSSTLDLDQRLHDILRVSLDATEASAGSIALYRPSDNKLVFQYVVGPKSAELTGMAIPVTGGVAGNVFRTGEAQITHHEAPTDVDKGIGYITHTMMTVPLKYQAGRPVGVMQILNRASGDFSKDDLEVVEIVASLAATAIQNAQLHREAQSAAIAHLVGGLSHDIKNKVAPISGWIETLWPIMDDMCGRIRSLPDATPAVDAIEDFQSLYPEGFQVISDQVKVVQDYTKLIADALKGSITEPQIEPNDLVTIIKDQLQELEAVAKQHKVTLVVDLAPMPRCRFDKLRIQQAVYNLVNNAIPETPSGGRVELRTTFTAEGTWPDGSWFLIEVSDTGAGMPANVLERILSGDAKSTKPGGSGLGTRIVFNAVEAHRGKFEGESVQGEGTRFRLRIPFAVAD